MADALDGSILAAGYKTRLRIVSIDGVADGTIYTDSDTVTAGEAVIGTTSNDAFPTLTAGKAYVIDGAYSPDGGTTWSAWSNTVTKTMAAATSVANTDARAVAPGYAGGSDAYAFTGCAIGTATATRRVWAVFYLSDGLPTGCDFNGAAGTLAGVSASGLISAYYKDIAAGTTCTVTPKSSSTQNRIMLQVFTSDGLNTVSGTTKLDWGFNTSPQAVSVVTATGGKSFVAGFVDSPTGTGSWTNATFSQGVTTGSIRTEGATISTSGTVSASVSGWGDKNCGLIAVRLAP